jgi:hypothetical protein
MNNNHIHDSNNLSQGVHDRQSGLLLPIQERIEEQQNIVMKEKKCHGNRKLQHFKRKCRARGLNEEQSAALIDARHHAISEQLLNDQTANNQIKKSTKRKRDRSEQNLINSSIKSLSQLSITPAVSKKAKNSTQQTILSIDNYSNHSSQENLTFYKPSKYLKMPRKLLLHSLRLQLNHRLKKKKEQGFMVSRLQIVDQQFCLDQIRHLYQTYFDLGLKSQVWPVSLKFSLSVCFLTIYICLF